MWAAAAALMGWDSFLIVTFYAALPCNGTGSGPVMLVVQSIKRVIFIMFLIEFKTRYSAQIYGNTVLRFAKLLLHALMIDRSITMVIWRPIGAKNYRRVPSMDEHKIIRPFGGPPKPL